jgi:hypothetical protein
MSIADLEIKHLAVGQLTLDGVPITPSDLGADSTVPRR